jgi:hypothetical protein
VPRATPQIVGQTARGDDMFMAMAMASHQAQQAINLQAKDFLA